MLYTARGPAAVHKLLPLIALATWAATEPADAKRGFSFRTTSTATAVARPVVAAARSVREQAAAKRFESRINWTEAGKTGLEIVKTVLEQTSRDSPAGPVRAAFSDRILSIQELEGCVRESLWLDKQEDEIEAAPVARRTALAPAFNARLEQFKRYCDGKQYYREHLTEVENKVGERMPMVQPPPSSPPAASSSSTSSSSTASSSPAAAPASTSTASSVSASPDSVLPMLVVTSIGLGVAGTTLGLLLVMRKRRLASRRSRSSPAVAAVYPAQAPDPRLSPPPGPQAANQRGWVLSGADSAGHVVQFTLVPAAGAQSSTWFLGRDSRAVDCAIPVETVSSKHAQIRHSAGRGLEICDLGSTNGTRVDGRPVRDTYAPLDRARTIALGSFEMTLRPL